MVRLGLCCQFRDAPIKFSTTTATSLARLPRAAGLEKLSRISLANADALLAALTFCAEHGIGCFRVNSQILPVKTHPEQGYSIDELPDGAEVVRRFEQCGRFARQNKIRTSFHPDQFVVLNSPKADVVEKSLREIEYQAEVATWIGADVINIHAGGAYGDKGVALDRFVHNVERLSSLARRLLTVENDDTTYTPADLLPICKAAGIPLVYDVHHHRCLPDGLTVEQATRKALATWNREPMFHLSSPRDGWAGPHPERHHDFIDLADFPPCWRRKKITVEVEAKAKEQAVERLRNDLQEQESSAPQTWSVYLLCCSDGSLYTGISKNVARRLEQHNAGSASRYTRSRLPVRLVHHETHANHGAALRRELEIKRLSAREKQALVNQSKPIPNVEEGLL